MTQSTFEKDFQPQQTTRIQLPGLDDLEALVAYNQIMRLQHAIEQGAPSRIDTKPGVVKARMDGIWIEITHPRTEVDALTDLVRSAIAQTSIVSEIGEIETIDSANQLVSRKEQIIRNALRDRAFMAAEARKLFSDGVLTPETARQMEERQVMDLWEEFADRGLSGFFIPTEYGGQGGTIAGTFQLVRELAKVSGSAAIALLASDILATLPVLNHGSEEVKRKILPAVVRGEHGCLNMTKLDGGSSPAMWSQGAVIVHEDGSLTVSDSWDYNTNGATADFYVCYSRGDQDNYGKDTHAFVVIMEDAEVQVHELAEEEGGFARGKQRPKTVVPAAQMGTTYASKLHIPADQVLSTDGNALREIVFTGLDVERVVLAEAMLGSSWGLYKEVMERWDERLSGLDESARAVIQLRIGQIYRKLKNIESIVDRAGIDCATGEITPQDASAARNGVFELATEMSAIARELGGAQGLMAHEKMLQFSLDIELYRVGGGSIDVTDSIIGSRVTNLRQPRPEFGYEELEVHSKLEGPLYFGFQAYTADEIDIPESQQAAVQEGVEAIISELVTAWDLVEGDFDVQGFENGRLRVDISDRVDAEYRQELLKMLTPKIRTCGLVLVDGERTLADA